MQSINNLKQQLFKSLIGLLDAVNKNKNFKEVEKKEIKELIDFIINEINKPTSLRNKCALKIKVSNLEELVNKKDLKELWNFCMSALAVLAIKKV